MVPTDRVLPRLSVLLSRGLIYLIGLTVLAGITWASIARVNVVVTAKGRLAPRAEPVRLSIAAGGVVSAVLVQVGANVHAGQAILAIDSFREEAEVARVRHELDETKAEEESYKDSAAILASASVHVKQEIVGAQKMLDLTSQQARAMREAYDADAVSLFDLQEREGAVAEAQTHIAQLQSDLNRSDAEGRKDRGLALGTSQKVEALEIELARDIQARRRTVLAAPIAGTVSYVSSLRPGRYLAANDVAATIVPGDEPLFAEVFIPNASMRRVKPLLRTRMKLDAYPYQRFGQLPGTLVSVDPDADQSGAYRAWIRPDRLTLDDSQGPEIVRTGLALTAEIEVDRRTVMSVMLDPFRHLRRDFRFTE
jgi:multidrug efflux pump subunit AcrA (membrane-fusion protein)